MDFSFWIVLWIIFLVLQNVLDKKKPKKLPPPDSANSSDSVNSPDFEIPTLANDPNFPGEDKQILIQESTPTAEVREINLQDYFTQRKLSAQNNFGVEEKKSEQVEQKKLPLGLNPESAMDAIIMSEILNKPKALRKK